MSSADQLSSLIDRASDALTSGGLIGLPTDTQYALSALAKDGAAVMRCYALKQRPDDDAMPIFLPSLDWLPTLPCDSGSATVRKYCHASFPGITSLPAPPTSLPGFGGVHEIAPRSFLCYTERWQVFSVAKRSRG